MLCSALTKKGEPCKKDHHSGCTHQGVDGWVYFLCLQHYDMIQEGKDVTLDKNPARGHQADQPQLDINNPVHNAWANKEDEHMLTYEEVNDLLDFDAIQDTANQLYGTNYRHGQNRMVTYHSGQANDGSRVGDLFCGSEYIGHVYLYADAGAIKFDRGVFEPVTTDLQSFLKDVDPVLGDLSEYGVMVTGHRANHWTQEDIDNMSPLMDRVVTKLKEEMNIVVISGGADGADRLWARAAMRNEVPFDLVLPHEDYGRHYFGTSPWFRNMVASARNVSYTSSAPKFHWTMNFARNIDMINRAEAYVVVSDISIESLLDEKHRGGTAHCVRAMKAAGVQRVIKINPRTNKVSWVTL